MLQKCPKINESNLRATTVIQARSSRPCWPSKVRQNTRILLTCQFWTSSSIVLEMSRICTIRRIPSDSYHRRVPSNSVQRKAMKLWTQIVAVVHGLQDHNNNNNSRSILIRHSWMLGDWNKFELLKPKCFHRFRNRTRPKRIICKVNCPRIYNIRN